MRNIQVKGENGDWVDVNSFEDVADGQLYRKPIARTGWHKQVKYTPPEE